MSNNTTSILRKINKKIDGLTSDKSVAKELKAEIKELAGASVSTDIILEQLEAVSAKLDNLESENSTLKETVREFVSSASQSIESIENSSEEEKPEELLSFLKELDKKVENLSAESGIRKISYSLAQDSSQFDRIKEELTFFQNELETRINDNFSDIGETAGKIIIEIREKMTDLQEIIEHNSQKLLNDVINDIKELKSKSIDIEDSILAIDKDAVKNTEQKIEEIIDNSQKQTEQILNEVNELKNISAKADVFDAKNKETIEIFKNELNSLRNNIHTQIREVLNRIIIQDEIKYLCEEAKSGISHNRDEIGVAQRHLKDLKISDEKQAGTIEEIFSILSELSEYELNENADKIDIMYENLTMLNSWAGNSDKLTENFNTFSQNFDTLRNNFEDNSSKIKNICEGFDILREDFDFNSDKIDIIYENLTFINEWVKTLDKFAKDIDILKAQCETSTHLPEKIEEISQNISLMKDWNKKADALALQVRALSVQISETESTVNSKNLSDMKIMFAQLTEDMANVSSRTNKLIIESDKANDVLQGHLVNLQLLIGELERKSTNFNIERISPKLEELKRFAEKRSGFDKVVTESFGYLAEWIDAAGSTISSIKEELSELQIENKQQTELISETQDKQIKQISQFEDEQVATWAGIQEIQKLNIKKLQEQQANLFEKLTEMQAQKFIQLQEEQNARLQFLHEQQNIQFNRIKEEQNLFFEQLQNFQSQQISKFIEHNDEKFVKIENCQLEQNNILQKQSNDFNEFKAEVTEKIMQSNNNEITDCLKNLTQIIEQKETDNKEKINELSEKISVISENTEIKSMIDLILSKIEVLNENNKRTDLIEKKIEVLDSKISSIEKYIEILIEFLEED